MLDPISTLMAILMAILLIAVGAAGGARWQRLREHRYRIAESKAQELRLLGVGVAGLRIFKGRVWFSTASAALLGMGDRDTDLSCEEWLACIHPDDRPAAEPAYRAILE